MPAKITRSAQPAQKQPHRPKFPIRKPALVRAADAETVAPINATKIKAHYVGPFGYQAIWWSQKVAFAALLLTVIWAGFVAHRTFALAEVGELTCSDKSSLMWLQPDPGSNVPALNDTVALACAKAYRPFG
jgi:hypothetical protein